jgi:hypothetical protein
MGFSCPRRRQLRRQPDSLIAIENEKCTPFATMGSRTRPHDREREGGSDDLVFDIDWSELEATLTERWPKLDREDLDAIQQSLSAMRGGDPERLVARLRERYGMTRDQASTEVRLLLRQLSENDAPRPEHSPAS